MIPIKDPGEEEYRAFIKWVKNLFNNDPIATHLALQIFRSLNDKQTSLVGVIVESEPTPIEDSEIANLALFLTEKGLPTKHKRDIME